MILGAKFKDANNLLFIRRMIEKCQITDGHSFHIVWCLLVADTIPHFTLFAAVNLILPGLG